MIVTGEDGQSHKRGGYEERTAKLNYAMCGYIEQSFKDERV